MPDLASEIIFSENVVNWINSNIQSKDAQSFEAGGQLFADLSKSGDIDICEITGPYDSDKRSRYGWAPDTDIMSQDRVDYFKKGINVVGLWHTHPESIPSSSLEDRQTAEKHLNLLESAYTGFLLITMGYNAMSVELITRHDKQWHKLQGAYSE